MKKNGYKKVFQQSKYLSLLVVAISQLQPPANNRKSHVFNKPSAPCLTNKNLQTISAHVSPLLFCGPKLHSSSKRTLLRSQLVSLKCIVKALVVYKVECAFFFNIYYLWGDFLPEHQLCFSHYAWMHTVKQKLSSFIYDYHQWIIMIIIH